MSQNVLLITIDCLRADHAGFMGYGRPATPNLDRLAAECVTFRRAFATGPRTAESFPGILASAYPLLHGAGYALTDRHTTLSERLQRSRYRTAAFHSNPYLSTNYGYHRGFDTFWDSLDAVSQASKVGQRVNAVRKIDRHSFLYQLARRLGFLWQSFGRSQPFVRAELLNQRVTRWLAGRPHPFFLWLHYMDPHYPYLPPDEHFRLFAGGPLPRFRLGGLFAKMLEDPAALGPAGRGTLIDLYDAEIHAMDAAIGRLLDHLVAEGLYDDLLLVVTADHGEEFGEHGEFSHATWASEVRDGRVVTKLHDELIHVPLLIRLPGAQYAGTQVEGLVSLLDVAPTIAASLGIEPPEGWWGRSLLPLLTGEGQARPFVFSEYQVHNRGFRGPVIACRTENWKYIHEGVFGQHELYDLNGDPGEGHNLFGRQPDVRDRLAAHVAEHLRHLEEAGGLPTEVEVDEELADRLRALGYIG
jgi:arylsulfatase A-like enzyme